MKYGSSLRCRSLLPAIALACACAPGVAHAGDIDLFSPETISGSADVRAVAASGETGWASGGFGKLRYGGEAGARLGNADLVWQPRLGWSVSAQVTASAIGGPNAEAGISEAFLAIHPRLSGPFKLSSRIGFVWAPLSLEHEGADWHVADTITPSAINSWVGEELRPLAAEVTASTETGGHRLSLTAALFTMNDTAGTLLALRGWAFHDRKTLLGHAQPLPPLAEELEYVQPRFTHPSIYLGESFARKPGWYVKAGWSPPLPVRVEVAHYDNRADPEDVNAELEWGWATRFDQLAAQVRLSERLTFKAQAMSGQSRMGYAEDDGHLWVESRFRAAYGLLAWRGEQGGIALRGDVFGTRQTGSLVNAEDAEHGWAATLAAHHDLLLGKGRPLALWFEALHVSSTRTARLRLGEAPHQAQDQVQLVLRGSW